MIEGDFQGPNWLDLQRLHHNLSTRGIAKRRAAATSARRQVRRCCSPWTAARSTRGSTRAAGSPTSPRPTPTRSRSPISTASTSPSPASPSLTSRSTCSCTRPIERHRHVHCAGVLGRAHQRRDLHRLGCAGHRQAVLADGGGRRVRRGQPPERRRLRRDQAHRDFRTGAGRGVRCAGTKHMGDDGARLRVDGPPRLSQDTQRFGVSRRATSQSSPQRRAGGLLASAGVSPSRWPPASSWAPSRPPLEVASAPGVIVQRPDAWSRRMPWQRRSTRPGRRAAAPPTKGATVTGRVNRLAPPRPRP